MADPAEAHPAIAAGNVAVITGAAHGIGQAIAQRCIAEGMRVAMLDRDADALGSAAEEFGDQAIALPCDVADLPAMEAVREQILNRWQTPSLLVNNAASRVGKGLDAPLEEWRLAVEVNMWGVVHGVRAFLPAMQASGMPAAIVTVGSKQGITNPPAHPVYNMTKAAVKIFTECLEHDLRQSEDRMISAHLLVPGFTSNSQVDVGTQGSWAPSQVADRLMDGLGRGAFYIVCPDDEVSEEEDRARIAWAAQDITEGRPALSRWHPDWAAVYKTSRA